MVSQKIISRAVFLPDQAQYVDIPALVVLLRCAEQHLAQYCLGINVITYDQPSPACGLVVQLSKNYINTISTNHRECLPLIALHKMYILGLVALHLLFSRKV